MSNDVREQTQPVASESGDGPLRHFRVGRRHLLQSLATGVGAAMFASGASAAHVHQAAAAAVKPEDAAAASPGRVFLDPHAFDTLVLLSEQIVPGARAAQVPEFLDRLLAVESIETQKRFAQALGAFEREAREAHGKPWKALTDSEATVLLTKISALPESEPARRAFEGAKRAIAESYYSSEAGMKELGWNGGVAFAPPAACG
jgi:Gluconate 2-dehydrogenase subunit 3